MLQDISSKSIKNMYRQLNFTFLLLVYTFFALFVSPAVAQTATIEPPDSDFVSPTLRLNPSRFQERAELREERVENRQERRADFAQNHANRIERRFNLYVDHLLNLASRIETRAQMMSKNGKNVNEALAKVTEARTYIDSAQVRGADAVSQFRSINPATYETQREIALAARDLAEAAREDFKTARDLLHEAVKILVTNQVQN